MLACSTPTSELMARLRSHISGCWFQRVRSCAWMPLTSGFHLGNSWGYAGCDLQPPRQIHSPQSIQYMAHRITLALNILTAYHLRQKTALCSNLRLPFKPSPDWLLRSFWSYHKYLPFYYVRTQEFREWNKKGPGSGTDTTQVIQTAWERPRPFILVWSKFGTKPQTHPAT